MHGFSSAEQATKPVVLIKTRRPSPPAELTEAEAEVWRDTVGCLPADWFRKSTWPVLASYCRHAARGAFLAQQAAAFRPEWLGEEGGLQRLDKLLAMAERETRALTACARALRLTPQSQMHPRTAGRVLAGNREGPRPWER